MRVGIPLFAAKNALRHKSLTVVTVAVVALGIGLFSALSPILQNMVVMSQDFLSNIGNVTVVQKDTNA